MEKLVSIAHRHDMPIIFHSDGDAKCFIEMLIDLGIHGVNPLQSDCNDILRLKKKYGSNIVLMGNLDIGGILAAGTPSEVKVQTQQLLRPMMEEAGYIAMSSSSLADSVIPENYMAMVDTVLEYGKYQ